MATKKSTKPEKKPTKAKKAEVVEKKASKPKFDLNAMYSDSLDVIEKRQGFVASSLDAAPPISSGMLAVDLMLGGGIRPCMMTGVAQEQGGKTTLALTVMASAIKQNVPIIAFADFEGCFTEDTLLGHGKGKETKIKDLFDLSGVETWEEKSWPGQTRTDIDTVETGHTNRVSGVRTGSLYYGGVRPTSTVTLDNEVTFTGYAHPFFVVQPDGSLLQKPQEELLPGDVIYANHGLKAAESPEFPGLFKTLVVSVVPTGKLEHVYDVSLLGVAQDEIPHSIFTNGIVTHNSTKNSKPYVHSILKGAGVNMTMDEVFGKRNKDGKWITPPRVRYRAETILENFYDWLSEILRDLPDKKYVENKWWLVFDDDKKNKAKVGEFVDASMTRKYGNGLWVEAPDGNMQGIMFVDSYTAMQPKIKDEEEIGNQLSVKASAFSKQLERVKGRMANKMVTVYGLNHLRDNPMAMYGPKESEKGGKALQQFCFSGSTLLATSHGMLRSSEIAHNYAQKD